jgi:hypothetical protein
MALAISILSMTYFSLLILWLLAAVILIIREILLKINFQGIKKKKMSYASSGRKMKFYEDFYAVTVVSYIYYENDEKIREA